MDSLCQQKKGPVEKLATQQSDEREMEQKERQKKDSLLAQLAKAEIHLESLDALRTELNV